LLFFVSQERRELQHVAAIHVSDMLCLAGLKEVVEPLV